MNQTVLIGRTFEFAASHRLQSAALSEAENQAQYGRCNNACGHGHNYRIEVTVEHPTEGNSRMADIDLAVQAGVLSRFDHQNLDARPEFAGRVTSVEHIAAVCFDLLQRELAALGIPLRRVQVWETDRTSATVDAAR